MRDYQGIETLKLEKLHYAVLKLIEHRKSTGKIQGQTFTVQQLRPEFLRELFAKADQDNSPGDQESDLLGMHYYIAVLNKLPLSKVQTIEFEMQREIKFRKELIRQRLDAGNLDKVVKGECKK